MDNSKSNLSRLADLIANADGKRERHIGDQSALMKTYQGCGMIRKK